MRVPVNECSGPRALYWEHRVLLRSSVLVGVLKTSHMSHPLAFLLFEGQQLLLAFGYLKCAILLSSEEISLEFEYQTTKKRGEGMI